MNQQVPGQQHAFLKDLQNLFAFLASLSGTLASFSVFFPLANVFVKVIPLDNLRVVSESYVDLDGNRITDYILHGALTTLTPGVVTAVATVATLFVMFLIVTGRERFKKMRRRQVVIAAVCCFIGAFSSLLGYIAFYAQVPNRYSRAVLTPDWQPYQSGMQSDILLMLLYIAFFVLATLAFMLLGMMEYYELGK